MLKLRSREEYLRNEDVLCDIEYVYNCINSLKQLQFVLVQKPTYAIQNSRQQKSSEENFISFEQFCLNQQEATYHTLTSSLDISHGSFKVKKSRYHFVLLFINLYKNISLDHRMAYRIFMQQNL
jgi:hypothetical protein